MQTITVTKDSESAPCSPRQPRWGVHRQHDGTVAVMVYAPDATSVTFQTVSSTGATLSSVALAPALSGSWGCILPSLVDGTHYGFRVDGPWDPSAGHRFNTSKLLLDPYAASIGGKITWGQSLFGHQVDHDLNPIDATSATPGSVMDDTDSAGDVPHSVFIEMPPALVGPRVVIPWKDTVIYEAHVKGLTMRHPQVPPELRGTYSALAHPAIVDHLTTLGITSLQLLPIHAIGAEYALAQRSMGNYWGYSTVNYFSPEPSYSAHNGSPSAVVNELREAIATLNEAGIEVLLDVVYNHTNEGPVTGPTTCWRGLNAAQFYRLDSEGQDIDVTGTGGTVDFSNPWVIEMTLDSLRHWVTYYGVSGFRFDLATTLGRDTMDFTPDHPFFIALRSDPLLRSVKLIAEPWDIGSGGWQTGNFPTPFAEWNDRFRDDVRHFWLTQQATQRTNGDSSDESSRVHHTPTPLAALATRVTGSADLFTQSASRDGLRRTPLSSVNFITAHDGFTLADLTAYNEKHNLANGENNRDGTTNNRSWNHGVEGPTTSPDVLKSRRLTARSMLATLLLSSGVPMIVAGDELGRSQQGNNNPYNQDNNISWVDWTGWDVEDYHPRRLGATVSTLTTLRKDLAGLGLSHFLHDGAPEGDARRNWPFALWFNVHGNPMTDDQWTSPERHTVQALIITESTNTIRSHHGALLVFRGSTTAGTLTLPSSPHFSRFELLWDSEYDDPRDVPHVFHGADTETRIGPLAVRVYRGLR